MASAANSSF